MAELATVQAKLAQYPLQDQYNCDETGLFWKAIPDRSLSTVPLPGLKKVKDRVTIHHCMNATGTHKLQPWIIGKYSKPRCFAAAGVNVDRLNCTWRANSKAWMTSVLFEQWLRWFDNQMAGRRVVLVMDNFSAHRVAVDELLSLPTEFSLRSTEVIWLPANSTSKTQPLDQGIIAAFKAIYRRHWLRYMADEIDQERDPQKTMNTLKTIRFVIRAWDEVKPQTIANCWQHSKLNINLPTEPFVQLQHQEAITEVQQQLQRLQQSQYIREAMNIQQILAPIEEVVEDSYKDITEQIAQQHEPVMDEDSEPEEIEVLPRIRAEQALKLLQQLRLHEEQSDDCNVQWLRSLDSYKRVVNRRRLQGLGQGSLVNWLRARDEST